MFVRKIQALAFVCVLSLSAQEFRSTIGGAVTDQQGAVLPGIAVLAVQIDTGANFRTVTAEDGQYTLPFVPPGLYRVEVSAPGFKKFLRTGIQVSARLMKYVVRTQPMSGDLPCFVLCRDRE